jgi:pimeloyl-ACP methyl ester carboxylesterase
MTHRRFALNGETLVLDDTLRASIHGTFIQLPDGNTWYELAGPAGGPTVVFINGYSIPHHLWDHNFNALADAGFRVLRFDHFGRGWSDRPNVIFDENLFDKQILDLLDALHITGKVSLVGSSMGGIVSSIFADRHPERVDRLALIDPAGTMNKPHWPKSALLVPVLGELVMHLTGDLTIPAGMAEDLLYPDRFPEYVAKYLPQMKIAGFKRAILSTYRSGLLFEHRDVYDRLGQSGLPILLIWGKHDATIPLSTGEGIRQRLPNADWRLIEDAGHVPHYEAPDAVNPMLIEFLKRA